MTPAAAVDDSDLKEGLNEPARTKARGRPRRPSSAEKPNLHRPLPHGARGLEAKRPSPDLSVPARPSSNPSPSLSSLKDVRRSLSPPLAPRRPGVHGLEACHVAPRVPEPAADARRESPPRARAFASCAPSAPRISRRNRRLTQAPSIPASAQYGIATPDFKPAFTAEEAETVAKSFGTSTILLLVSA